MAIIWTVAICSVPASFPLAFYSIHDRRRGSTWSGIVKFALWVLMFVRAIPAAVSFSWWVGLIAFRGNLPHSILYGVLSVLALPVAVVPLLTFWKKLYPADAGERGRWLGANVATIVIAFGVYIAIGVFSLPL